MKKFFIFFITIIIASASATAQIVNAESERIRSDSAGWKGGGSLNLSLSQNVEKIFGLDAEAHLQYTTTQDKGLWLILGNYGFLKLGTEEHISNALLHLRYNKKINNWLRWEVFGQFQNNAITQIDSRYLIGTGPRYKIIKIKKFRLYAGTLVMYEREKEKTDPVITHNDIRNSDYISFTWAPKNNITLTSTTYIQPLIKKISDYRIMNQTSFEVKASPHFGLCISWNYLFDRFPAGTSPRTTYGFSTGIDYDF